MKALLMAVLLVGAVALVTDKDDEAPAPAQGVEQRDPNLGPVGSVR